MGTPSTQPPQPLQPEFTATTTTTTSDPDRRPFPASAPSTTKKRTRPVSACETCRRKKTKCVLEEDQPICKGCSHAGVECLFRVDDLSPSLRNDARFAGFPTGENSRKVITKSKQKKSSDVGQGKEKEKGKGKGGVGVEGNGGANLERTSSSTSSSDSNSTSFHSGVQRWDGSSDEHRPQSLHLPSTVGSPNSHPHQVKREEHWSFKAACNPSLSPSINSPSHSQHIQPRPETSSSSSSSRSAGILPWNRPSTSTPSSSSPFFNYSHGSRDSCNSMESSSTHHAQSLPSFRTAFHHLDPPTSSPSTQAYSHPHSTDHSNPLSRFHSTDPSNPLSRLHSTDLSNPLSHQRSASVNSTPFQYQHPPSSSPTNHETVAGSSSGSSGSKLSGVAYQAISTSSPGFINRSNSYQAVDAFPLPASHNTLNRWYKGLPTPDSERIERAPSGLEEMAHRIGGATKMNKSRQNASLRLYDEKVKKREEMERRKKQEMESEARAELRNSTGIASGVVVASGEASSPTQVILTLEEMEKQIFSWFEKYQPSPSNSEISNSDYSRPTSSEVDLFFQHCSEIAPWINQTQFTSIFKPSESTESEKSIFNEVNQLASVMSSIATSCQILKPNQELNLLSQAVLLQRSNSLQHAFPNLLDDSLRNPSIEAVQILYLLAFKAHLDSRPEVQFLIIGSAWRMIQVLGMEAAEKVKGSKEDQLVRCVALHDKWIGSKTW